MATAESEGVIGSTMSMNPSPAVGIKSDEKMFNYIEDLLNCVDDDDNNDGTVDIDIVFQCHKNK